MTAKTNYTAHFSDGTTETRASHRPYSAAWIVWPADDAEPKTGFSGDYEKAEKAATTELKRIDGLDYEIVEPESDAVNTEGVDAAAVNTEGVDAAGPKSTKWPDDAVLEFRVTTNPKRDGSKSAERYDGALETIDGNGRATVKDLVAAGYRRDDMSWDYHRSRFVVEGVDVEGTEVPTNAEVEAEAS